MTVPDPSTLDRPAARRGPKPRLSRERIADAALAIGVDDLTMARVARHLGTTTGALYRYVADRDELVVVAAERLFETAPWPEVTTWRAFLDAEVWIQWELLTGNPGLTAAVKALRRSIQGSIARYGRLVLTLCELGFDEEDAMLAVDTVVDLVHDGAAQHHAIVRATAGDGIERIVAARRAYFGPDSEAVLRRLLADPQAFFARKVHLVLDGIERLAPEAVGDADADRRTK